MLLLHRIIPLLGSLVWLATLATLISLWRTNSEPKYKYSQPSVPYISHIGAHYKTLFVTLASITAGLYIATLFIFIFHNYHKQLAYQNEEITENNQAESTLSRKRSASRRRDILSFIFGVISAASLILLAVFDTINHETTHWIFTLIFIFGAILSSIFNVMALAGFRKERRLRHISYGIKIFFIILATLLVIAMIVLMNICSSSPSGLSSSCNVKHSISAVMEWSIGVLFALFLFSWIWDM